MIKVYRLEKPILVGGEVEMFGPFTAGVYEPSLDSVLWRYKRSLGSPIREPHEEGIKFSYPMVCGFIDWYQMCVWCRWCDVYESLVAVGFRIGCYGVPVDKLHQGETQVAFRLDDATFLGEVTYDEMRERLVALAKSRRSKPVAA